MISIVGKWIELKQYCSNFNERNYKKELQGSNQVIDKLNDRNVETESDGDGETKKRRYSKNREDPKYNTQCTSHCKFVRRQSLAECVIKNVFDMFRTELHTAAGIFLWQCF